MQSICKYCTIYYKGLEQIQIWASKQRLVF